MERDRGQSNQERNREDWRPLTVWTEVARIRGLAETEAKEASLALCERYREVVMKEFEIRIQCLRRAGFEHPSVGDASDLAHEFLFVHVPGCQIIQKARAERGRFRHFLWKCLDNFWKDKLRLTKKTAPVEESEDAFDQASNPSAAGRFDVTVARQLGAAVLTQILQQQRDEGTEGPFLVLRPFILLREHGQQIRLAKELKTTAPNVSRWLKQLDADFLRKFRDRVVGVVWNPRDPQEIEEEYKYLLGLWLAWRQEGDAT